MKQVLGLGIRVEGRGGDRQKRESVTERPGTIVIIMIIIYGTLPGRPRQDE